MRVARLVHLPAGRLAAGNALPALSRHMSGDGDDALAALRGARDLRDPFVTDGGFKMTHVWHSDDRPQLVHTAGVAGQTCKRRPRRVFRPAAQRGNSRLEAGLATALLRDDRQRILGCPALGDACLRIVAQLPDGIDAVGLETAIAPAAVTADDKGIQSNEGGGIF